MHCHAYEKFRIMNISRLKRRTAKFAKNTCFTVHICISIYFFLMILMEGGAKCMYISVVFCQIKQLLKLNPSERLTAEQSLQHPFFQSQVSLFGL